MQVLNWRRVLDSAGVEYVEHGANVKRGHVNIRCPFCGNADPSHHMGLDLETGWWSCWRNRRQHSGKSPLRLLVRLLGCSYYRAREIAGLTDGYVDPEGFDAVAARVMKRDGVERIEEVRRDFLHLPESDLAPLRYMGSTRKHYDYLVYERGFLREDIPLLTRWYGVCAAVSGTYHDRILLPYIFQGELVAWTARAVADAKIRYLDLYKSECLIEPKNTLYNHDCMIDGGDILLVVEGPIDTLKLDLYGRDWGVRTVGLSTNSISDDQIYLLEEGSYNFKHTLVMMDNAGSLGIVDSMKMKERLSQIRNLGFVSVPFGKKDGGDVSPSLVISFCRRLINDKKC